MGVVRRFEPSVCFLDKALVVKVTFVPALLYINTYMYMRSSMGIGFSHLSSKVLIKSQAIFCVTEISYFSQSII